jgi:hypothetical protein
MRLSALPALILCIGSFDVKGFAADSKADVRVQEVVKSHPRLYCLPDDLPRLRAAKTTGVHARIWTNLTTSADWCAAQLPRTEWIPTLVPDPIYENLYDRFYAAMHDSAIVEHLAFASILSDPEHDPYFEPARKWALAAARVWKNEAANKPDQSKAYSVLRVLKALAVAYDLLHDRLSEPEREQLRSMLVAVGREYFIFFADPVTAGKGYNKHHGSVDAAPFGVVALALLGEVPEANAWLDRMIEKHVDYLLPYALLPSGTSDQSSNFWASTLQYRIFFMDALRRVTGRDLFREFPDSLPGRIALAAVAGRQPRSPDGSENHRSVLFGPSYGQLDYWSPVLLFLAREQRRPIYQHLALWDDSIGQIQRTRYITPTRKEELLFGFGGYCYIWYDHSVADAIELDLPRAFEFPEPEVNEAYLRDSYKPGGVVVAMLKGSLVVHAGGRPVLVDRFGSDDINTPAKPVDEMLVADDGRHAVLRCLGPKPQGIGVQRIELRRPGRVTIHREATKPLTWWYAGSPARSGNQLTWPDGTRLTVMRGSIEKIDPHGYNDAVVHYGGMKFADPHPFVYPVVTMSPDAGVIELLVELGRK